MAVVYQNLRRKRRKNIRSIISHPRNRKRIGIKSIGDTIAQVLPTPAAAPTLRVITLEMKGDAVGIALAVAQVKTAGVLDTTNVTQNPTTMADQLSSKTTRQ